jgi:hypothetical protein
MLASPLHHSLKIARVLMHFNHVARFIMPERVLVLIDYIRPDILGVPQARCKSCPTKTVSLSQRKRKNETLKFAI